MPTTKQKQAKRRSRTTANGGSKSLATTARRMESKLGCNTLESMTMSRPMGAAFPTRLRRKLLYFDQYTIASSVGAVGLQQFRVNSLFDPDLTGTGHQPRGFDQLCTATGPYTRYRVMGVSIVLQYIADNSPVMTIAAGFSDASTLPSVAGGGIGSIAGNGELPGWLTSLSNTYGSNVKELAFAARIADIESKPEASIRAEDGYAATSGASPVDVCYFSIQAQAVGAATSNLDVLVKIEFDAEFEGPWLLAAS